MNKRPSTLRLFDASTPRRVIRALLDVRDGFSLWRLVLALAWGDIKQRYRGSLLGPFWVTLTTSAMIIALGFFYSFILKVDPGSYFPWLAISLILWAMISQVVTEGSECFTSAEAVIRQMSLPYSVYVMRIVMRNLMVFLHNMPLLVVVMVLFDVAPGLSLLAFLPGFILFLINAFWVAFFLGIVCARFRDIPPIIASAMQLLFFVTPIIWLPEQLGDRSWWLVLNPVNAIIETMRSPLLGRPLDLNLWLHATGYTATLSVISFGFFVRFRGRIAFWV